MEKQAPVKKEEKTAPANQEQAKTQK